MARLSQEYEYARVCHTTSTTYYSSREVASLTGADGKFNRMTEWFGGYYFKRCLCSYFENLILLPELQSPEIRVVYNVATFGMVSIITYL